MFNFSTKNYLLSTAILFMIIGFILLISVIIFHKTINHSRYWLPMTIAGKDAGVPIPQEVIDEVVRSNKNIYPLPINHSDNSPLFITQE